MLDWDWCMWILDRIYSNLVRTWAHLCLYEGGYNLKGHSFRFYKLINMSLVCLLWFCSLFFCLKMVFFPPLLPLIVLLRYLIKLYSGILLVTCGKLFVFSIALFLLFLIWENCMFLLSFMWTISSTKCLHAWLLCREYIVTIHRFDLLWICIMLGILNWFSHLSQWFTSMVLSIWSPTNFLPFTFRNGYLGWSYYLSDSRTPILYFSRSSC